MFAVVCYLCIEPAREAGNSLFSKSAPDYARMGHMKCMPIILASWLYHRLTKPGPLFADEVSFEAIAATHLLHLGKTGG